MPRPPKASAAKPKVMTSWSFTRWSDHDKCPLFAKLKHLDKVPEPKSDAMLRGAAVAKASEDYLLGKTKKLIPELQTFTDEYKFYKSQKNLMVEENWGFSRSWEPVDYFDWNNCALRVKIDIAYLDIVDNELHIRDGKTGKFREEDNAKYMLQLDLYTAAGIAKYPKVKWVVPRLNYTDLGITFPDGDKYPDIVYSAEEARQKQKEWDKRIIPMFKDTRFPPRPGNHCRWCPFSKAKGGTCKF